MTGRRPTLTVLATLGLLSGGSLGSSAVASASAPETPVTEAATAVTGTTALLHGELNPTSEATDGYEFTYNTNGTCTEGATTEPGTEATGKAIKVSTEVAGLVPNSEYTFCVVATHTEGETTESTSGPPLTVKTLAVKPLVESESGFSFTQTEATLEAQLNPNNQATTCLFEYGPSAILSGSLTAACEPSVLEGFGSQHASTNLAGLSPNTVYYYRVAAENGAGQAEGVPIQQFTTRPLLPTVTTGSASAITQTSATVAGVINGQGADTNYYFRYVEVAEYKPSEPDPYRAGRQLPSPSADAGVISSDTTELTQLTGLKPNTTYHYQLVAENQPCLFSCPGQTSGADATFTTLALAPIASADPPANLSPNSATLTGSVDPQGVSGSYYFEYGPTTAYGTSLPELTIPATESGLGVTANVSGLVPDTTYHFRVVGSNNGGVTHSDDEAFTTYATEGPSSEPPPPGFSLTGVAPGTPAAVGFANLTALAPVPQPPSATAITKALTNAQKLSRTLKACKGRSKNRRAACQKQARRKYASVKTKN
jgi:hypothetical protein